MRKIRVKNNIQAIREIAIFIEGLAAGCAFSDKAVFDLNLALEELVSNIVFYGYIDNDEHFIDIAIDCGNKKEAVITIEDDARPFNPLEVDHVADTHKKLEEREVGGLGILFVKKVMDDIAYERIGDKNRITLKRKKQD